ncbi:MAG TPA: hypothetical protein VKN18_23015 [Blastocatellia bacterium]|nr:hypothetical protein [Blastocatellia bacterium]
MNTGSVSLIIPVFNLLAFVAVGACQTPHANAINEPVRPHSSIDLSKINEHVTSEFLKAWNSSHNGVDKVEAVVLIFCKVDGSYFATALGQTNEPNKFRFKWDPAAIAIAHTHPTSIDPKPSKEDMRVADRLGVPILTMSRWGMYMYDPGTQRTTKVQNSLDWLEPSSWVQISDRRQDK